VNRGGSQDHAPATRRNAYRTLDRASVVGRFLERPGNSEKKIRKEETEDQIQGVTSWLNHPMQQTPSTVASPVRFFAGFTSSLPFRFSVIFTVRSKNFRTTPPRPGLSSFRSLCFRESGCGKAMLFEGLFRKDRGNSTLQRNWPHENGARMRGIKNP